MFRQWGSLLGARKMGWQPNALSNSNPHDVADAAADDPSYYHTHALADSATHTCAFSCANNGCTDDPLPHRRKRVTDRRTHDGRAHCFAYAQPHRCALHCVPV